MRKRKLLFYTLLLVNTYLLSIPVTTLATTLPAITSNFDETISPYADNIKWQYKAIDGVLHKRLYNYTTDTPLRDWIVVT